MEMLKSSQSFGISRKSCDWSTEGTFGETRNGCWSLECHANESKFCLEETLHPLEKLMQEAICISERQWPCLRK